MAEKDKGTNKRLTLTVAEIRERKPVGEKGAVKLEFRAKGEEGDKEFLYFTFSQSLMDVIEQGKGKAIDCDVVISTREWDGNTYTDRNVKQIYVGGQPVSSRRGPAGAYGDSPEKVLSIEAQTAYNGAIELMTNAIHAPASISEVIFDKLFKKALEWGTDRLERSLRAGVSQRAKSNAALERELFGGQEGEAKTAEKAKSSGFKNAGEFLSRCQVDFSLNKSQVLENKEVAALYDAGKFDEAFAKLSELQTGK